jgi:hypothetical protein
MRILICSFLSHCSQMEECSILIKVMIIHKLNLSLILLLLFSIHCLILLLILSIQVLLRWLISLRVYHMCFLLRRSRISNIILCVAINCLLLLSIALWRLTMHSTNRRCLPHESFIINLHLWDWHLLYLLLLFSEMRI